MLEHLDEGIRMTIDFDSIFHRKTATMLSSGTRLFQSFANLMKVGEFDNEVRITAGITSPKSVRDRSFSSTA